MLVGILANCFHNTPIEKLGSPGNSDARNQVTALYIMNQKLLDLPDGGQWLTLHIPNIGDPGSIPGQGTRSRMLQLKILHAATKTQHRERKEGKKETGKKEVVV